MEQYLTRKDIITGLEQLGLKPGAAVEVHSSLSSMGSVQDGAAAVIEALMEVVGTEGAIVMSAYAVTLPLPLTAEDKALGILAKVRFLKEGDDQRTGMGVVSDTFRRTPGTILGSGEHRLCAWGKDAEIHCQGYGHLLEIDGWVLLIGVDIHRCSSMHLAEQGIQWAEEITAYFHVPAEIRKQYPEDQWYVECKEAPEDAWGKVQLEAERRGLIRRGRIGRAGCMLFKARPVVELYRARLERDPYALFGIQRKGEG